MSVGALVRRVLGGGLVLVGYGGGGRGRRVLGLKRVGDMGFGWWGGCG